VGLSPVAASLRRKREKNIPVNVDKISTFIKEVVVASVVELLNDHIHV
jgi:ribosomal protein L18E